ncbi:MAG: hypothetical protein WC827_03560 [Candidatus Paceibacterota bacterium]|jgi:hypothetical protein
MREEKITKANLELAFEVGFRETECDPDWLLHTWDLPSTEKYKPTQSFIQKWLREKQNVHIWVIPMSLSEYAYYYFKDGGYTFSKCNFRFYESALEKGIYEGLNLIHTTIKL